MLGLIATDVSDLPTTLPPARQLLFRHNHGSIRKIGRLKEILNVRERVVS